MLTKNCSFEDLEKALSHINDKYQGNVEFRGVVSSGIYIRFTLKVKDCKAPGHRVHIRYDDPFGKCIEKRRRSSYACWHVHGDFFDALFDINPHALVISRGSIISKDGGNWIDTNVVSSMFPVYFSDSCDCAGEV